MISDYQDLRKRIKTLFEDPLREFPEGVLRPGSIGDQIAEEVSEGTRRDNEGRDFAPDQFTLSLHPGQIDSIKRKSTRLQATLSKLLDQALRESGLRLVRSAHLTLATDPTLDSGETRVIAWHSRDPLQLAEGQLPEVTPEEPSKERAPYGAFFVVAGREHFPLDQPVVNIGRLQDNDLILDDSRISRRHCQLRASRGAFLLKDLQSTAGTRVNEELVSERILQPGDVIRLGTVELVYGEDPTGPPEVTPPYAPLERAAGERDEITSLDVRRSETEELSPEDSDELP